MSTQKVIIISGLSGAGKSNAAKVLEDLGYHTVDNTPLLVVEKIVEIFHGISNSDYKLAFVIDSRSKDVKLAYNIIKMLKDRYKASLIFMDASVETLINRYKETRHVHPNGIDLIEAIKEEKSAMSDIKSIADFIYNSDAKTVHNLTDELLQFVEGNESVMINVTLQSFGFKNGVPNDADIVLDVRFLKNPYFVDALKFKTGKESDVADYVKQDTNFHIFIDKATDMYRFLLPLYIKEGKKYLNISIGCTGGHHRSVAVVEDLAMNIVSSSGSQKIYIKHRDIKVD